MAVAFDLVAQGQHGDIGFVLDLEQSHIARSSKRNDQFPQERALAGLAPREGRRLQGCDAGAPRLLWSSLPYEPTDQPAQPDQRRSGLQWPRAETAGNPELIACRRSDMKIRFAPAASVAAALATGVASAQSGYMMNGGHWGGGWMGGNGGAGLSVLLVVIVGLVAWIVMQKRK